MILNIRSGISLILVMMTAAWMSCSDNNGSSPAAALSMKVDYTALAKSAATDTVVITSAKILLKHIKFENEAEEDSSELKLGPFIVELNLIGGVTEIATGDLPNGTYDRVKFKIHKPEGNEDPGDPDFYEGPSGDQRFSVVVNGTFNGSPFTYKSKKDAEQKMTLNPPLVVSDTLSTTNVTLVVNPGLWFIKDGVYLDPTVEANWDDIDENIKNSFKKAFKDNDHDGEEHDDDDDHEDDHGDDD